MAPPNVVAQPKAGTGSSAALSGISGNFFLRVQIGKQDMDTTPESYTAIDIIEYIDRMLPAFTVTFKDPRGVLTQKVKLDSTYNTITFVFASPLDPSKTKDMKFRIYRRFPAAYTDVGNVITFTGLLDVRNMFSPQYQRGWEKVTADVILSQLASEMQIQNTRFDTLATPLTIVQPNWSNAVFLKYLAGRVTSPNQQGGFFAYVDTMSSGTRDAKWVKGSARLNFRSIETMLLQPAKYTCIIAKTTNSKDLLPIYNFEGTDNFELLNILGIGEQYYTYFDYETGEQISNEVGLDVMGKSLSEFVAYDSQIKTVGVSQNTLGRTTDFITDFEPLMKGRYAKKVNSLVKQWVTTRGVTDICCGDIVKVIQPINADPAGIMDYQYSGYWLVERVVHHIAHTYATKMLLTRPGVDGSKDSTLYRALNAYGLAG